MLLAGVSGILVAVFAIRYFRPKRSAELIRSASASKSETTKLKEELRSLGQSISDVAQSLENPSSEEDPGTVRARISRQESQWREITSAMRRRIGEIFRGKENEAERAEMERKLDAIEEDLDELKEKTESDDAGASEESASGR